jgi:hypothetical protein
MSGGADREPSAHPNRRSTHMAKVYDTLIGDYMGTVVTEEELLTLTADQLRQAIKHSTLGVCKAPQA